MEENGGEWSIDLENTNGNVTLREEDFESRAPFDFSVSGDTPDGDLLFRAGQRQLHRLARRQRRGALIFWNSSQQTKATFDETAGIPADGYMVFSSD